MSETKTFGQAATAGLTAAVGSQGQSTANSKEAHYQHFLKCLRLWGAMMPKKAGDDIDGELLAKGYYRMLGRLSTADMNALTEMVLSECKWFPTIAECREMMGRTGYDNPFYRSRRNDELNRLGYTQQAVQAAITAPVRHIDHE
jgi:hypothetical protein